MLRFNQNKYSLLTNTNEELTMTSVIQPFSFVSISIIAFQNTKPTSLIINPCTPNRQ